LEQGEDTRKPWVQVPLAPPCLWLRSERFKP